MSKKILIIEDESSLAEAVSISLKDAGFDVAIAKNGKEGLDKALADHPDLILLDQLMPVMEGTEVLEQLRGDDWGKDAIIIMMTNVSAIKTMNDALKKGIDDYILKAETELDEIVKLVKEKLK